MIYRREVDGLRTIAVVPVVMFHAGLPGFSGGYAGVDVFFVISGFLITTLILEDLERGRFSVAHFYERRARRILPALTLVVAATTIVAALTFLPNRLEEYGASMVSTAIFAANIYFWRTTDYFGTAAEERPLLHMWSLAVEEQFYIVFPLLLLAIWRWRQGRADAILWATFLVAAVCSFVLTVVSSEWKPVANFYLPVTRAWELLTGGCVALALKGVPPATTRFFRLGGWCRSSTRPRCAHRHRPLDPVARALDGSTGHRDRIDTRIRAGRLPDRAHPRLGAHGLDRTPLVLDLLVAQPAADFCPHFRFGPYLPGSDGHARLGYRAACMDQLALRRTPVPDAPKPRRIFPPHDLRHVLGQYRSNNCCRRRACRRSAIC